MKGTEALQAIAHELQHITKALAPATQQTLGFGTAPKSQVYVFCNRGNGGTWYTLDSESKPVNIDHQALTGYVRKLEFAKVQRRGSDVSKLHCTIEADRIYILESAHDSNFSKGLIKAIAFLSPSALRQPLTIVPQPSAKTAEVLFCNVFQGDEQVFASYDDQTDWKLASRAAIDAVRAANDEAAQPTSQAPQEAAA